MVPELICLTGLSDDLRSNFNIMKSLGKYTKLTAEDRMKEARKMIETLKKDEELIFEIDSTPKPLSGYKMPIPRIQVGNNR